MWLTGTMPIENMSSLQKTPAEDAVLGKQTNYRFRSKGADFENLHWKDSRSVFGSPVFIKETTEANPALPLEQQAVSVNLDPWSQQVSFARKNAPLTVACTSGSDKDISNTVNRQMQSDTARAFFYQFNKNTQQTFWILNLNITEHQLFGHSCSIKRLLHSIKK